jgi:hypothetical protein
VTVSGAEEAAVSLVEQAVADVLAWTGRTEICVTDIAVGEVEESDLERLGHYDSQTMQIDLAADQEDLRRTALHEICHALDRDDHYFRSDRDVLAYDPAAEDFAQRSEASRAREAFAMTCEAGPWELSVADTIGAACDLDLGAVSLVADEVFAEATDRAPVAAVSEIALGSWELPAGWEITTPLGVQGDANRLLVEVDRAGEPGVAVLDPDLGTLLGEQGGSTVPSGSWPGGPMPPVWEDYRVGRLADGTAFLSAEIPLASGARARGLLVWDGADVGVVAEHCAASNDGFAVLADRVLHVEADGRTLRWSAWTVDG